LPEVFKCVIFALVGEENVDDNIIQVDQYPSIFSFTFHFPVDLVFIPDILKEIIPQAFKHPVAGSGTNNEIVCKLGGSTDIHQDDILRFLFFQGIHDCMGYLKCVQM